MSSISNRPLSEDEWDLVESLLDLPVSGFSQGIAKTSSTTFENVTFGNGNTVWGSITGTLSAQTDLQTALDAKFTLPSLTSGSVLFSNGITIAQDNSNLFYDDTNNRLSVGAGTSPVGRLDLRNQIDNATLGSEIIANANDRTFTTDTGNWTGTNWTISGGKANHTAGANAFTLNLAALTTPPVAGGVYQVQFTIVTTTLGTLNVSYGGGSGVTSGKSVGTVSQSVIILASNTTGELIFTPNAAWEGNLDSISIKRITQEVTPTMAVKGVSDYAEYLELRAGEFAESIGIGFGSLRYNTSDNRNIAMGYGSLANLVDGYNNVAIGYLSMFYSTTATNNLAFGTSTLTFSTVGTNNVAIGDNSMNSNNGSFNVGIGASTIRYGVMADNNVVIGYQAGSSSSLTTSSNNILIGYKAANNQTTANNNIIIGYDIDAPSATIGGQLSIGNLIFGSGLSATGTTVSTGSIGIGVSSANISARLEVQNLALAATQVTTAGLALTNTTAATVGTQVQISPPVRWTGRGWKTNATAASQAVDFMAWVQPVTGAANPTGVWKLQSSINGAAYTDHLLVKSDGMVCLAGTTSSFPALKRNLTGIQPQLADDSAPARWLQGQGTDVASASTITLTNGNSFELTGTTTVNLITNTGWVEGSIITLIANESVTINHGTATSGSAITILLAGASNFAMTANDTLTLIYSSTTAGGIAWREICRTAI